MNNSFIPFKKEDITQERFYRVPKSFVEDNYFKSEMDSNMKMMYALLRDRYELSIKNNWVDNNGIVYCMYSREYLADDLNVSKNTVSKCIKKLTNLNLMKEVRNGQGKPNHMYISKVDSSHGNRSAKIGIQESQKLTPSDTDEIETEKIKRYTITSNGDYVFFYYNNKYKNHFGKEHPTITLEQLNRIHAVSHEYEIEYDITNEDWEHAIDWHFDNLPEGNNGNVLWMFSGDYEISPLIRMLEVK